jgi:phosphate transport system substrate-binding protein
VLVAGVEGERLALGYFGYSYYPEAKDKIRALKVKDDLIGGECVEPNDETASTFTYPLARPLFIYVNKKSWAQKPHLREFVIFYVENGEKFAKQVFYHTVSKPLLQQGRRTVESRNLRRPLRAHTP